MIKVLFLVSVLKGLETYRKPLFWAGLYVLFLFVMYYMFSLAANIEMLLPVLGLMAVNFVLSAALFTLLCALDGGRWLVAMGIGIFILSCIG